MHWLFWSCVLWTQKKLNARVWERVVKSSTEMKWKPILNYPHNGLLKPVISCFFLSSPLNACTKDKKGKLKNILHTPVPLAKRKTWFRAWQTCSGIFCCLRHSYIMQNIILFFSNQLKASILTMKNVYILLWLGFSLLTHMIKKGK